VIDKKNKKEPSFETAKVLSLTIKPYREVTWEAIVLGIIQGIILNIAFVYAALKLSFSLGGSTVAAISGYAILRGIMRKGTSIENNINQTIASGINTAGSGVVFTLPALFILDAHLKAIGQPGISFEFWPYLFAGIAGAILGVVVIIPLRKQMIDLDRLRFPTGVAVASIIRSGSAGSQKGILLVSGFLVSAICKYLQHISVIPEEVNFSFGIIPDYTYPIIYLSFMNFAAGLLTGKGGLPFFIGGAIAWWVIAPTAVNMSWLPIDDLSGARAFLRKEVMYPVGIGTLIGGALMGVVVAFPAMASALRALSSAAKITKSGVSGIGSDEMPLWVLKAGILGAVFILFIASYMVPGVSLLGAFFSSIVGTLWLGLAALIVAQATGMTDISPMSGIALISITLMMFMLNQNIAGALVIGVAVCVAIGQGADMMQDLKTGFMIGGRPIKQQAVQFCVTWIGAIVALGVVYILWKGGPNGQGGFGQGTDLPAAQGEALSAVLLGIRTGEIPWNAYLMGSGLGVLLGAAPIAGLGVLVGLAMYLPFSIILGYGIGCFVQMGLMKKFGASFCENQLVPLAAGLIVGEALIGVILTGFNLFAGG
jgi:putative OPT family oligopeptide transporter